MIALLILGNHGYAQTKTTCLQIATGLQPLGFLTPNVHVVKIALEDFGVVQIYAPLNSLGIGNRQSKIKKALIEETPL